MAELLLKIEPGAGYEDGDVLCAFNRRRIRQVHAEHVCKLDGFTREGLRPAQSLAKEFRHATHQYLFRRVSETTIERHDLWAGTVDTFGPESIDVREFLKRRLKHNAHGIFGVVGQEFWYGGGIDMSNERLNVVWNAIQRDTPRMEAEDEFKLWPMGRLDIRHHLAVRVADFSDEEAAGLVAPQVDDKGQHVAKRNIKVDWKRDILPDLGVTEADVLDREKPIGRDIELPAGRMRYESKDQPVQSDREKLHDKANNRPVRI